MLVMALLESGQKEAGSEPPTWEALDLEGTSTVGTVSRSKGALSRMEEHVTHDSGTVGVSLAWAVPAGHSNLPLALRPGRGPAEWSLQRRPGPRPSWRPPDPA